MAPDVRLESLPTKKPNANVIGIDATKAISSVPISKPLFVG
jgi:hypothetical protein